MSEKTIQDVPIETILTLLNDRDHLTRCDGIRLARPLVGTDERITAALIPMMRDDIIAVRVLVAKVLASVAKSNRTVLEAIKDRMKELEPKVYFDEHYIDSSSDAGWEYYTYARALAADEEKALSSSAEATSRWKRFIPFFSFFRK
jgi:hypothetical protein